jgi:hypothetical protein
VGTAKIEPPKLPVSFGKNGSRAGLAISMLKAEIHALAWKSTEVVQLMQLMQNYPR